MDCIINKYTNGTKTNKQMKKGKGHKKTNSPRNIDLDVRVVDVRIEGVLSVVDGSLLPLP